MYSSTFSLRHLTPLLLSMSTLGSSVVIPWPSHLNETSLSALFSRQIDSSVPSVETLTAHVNDIPKDSCIFYTGGTSNSCFEYAEAVGLQDISDSVDPGWTQIDSYSDESCPMNDNFQAQLRAQTGGSGWTINEVSQYWINLSIAFAMKCSGRAYVTVPPELSKDGWTQNIPENSIFFKYEFPAIIKPGGAVTEVRAIPMNVNGPASMAYPTDDSTLIWARCCGFGFGPDGRQCGDPNHVPPVKRGFEGLVDRIVSLGERAVDGFRSGLDRVLQSGRKIDSFLGV